MRTRTILKSKLFILTPHQVNNRTQKWSKQDNDEPQYFYTEGHGAVSGNVVKGYQD